MVRCASSRWRRRKWAAVGQGGPLGKLSKHFVRGVLECAQEFDIEFCALGCQQGKGGLRAGIVLIASVCRGEAAEVGT